MEPTAPPPTRQPGRTLYLYVAPEALRPTLFALFGLTAVVLTQQFMGLSELVVNRGVGTWPVLQMTFLEAVPLAAQMFPFSVLIGCLVALGRLGADREILALESLGISGSRLVWPVLAFAAVMTLVALPFSLYAGPWASRQLDQALDRISRQSPWAQIRGGVVNEFGGWQLQAVQANPKGDQLTGVLLWMPRLGQTVFAEHGDLGAAPDGSLEITLRNGSVLLSNEDGPRYLRFANLVTTLPAQEELQRDRERRLDSLSLAELAAQAREFVPSPDNRLPHAALVLYRRFALPSATLIFGFLAAPLFFTRRRFSRSSGGVLGLLATGAYYGLVQLGQGLVGGGHIGPALAAWLPNIVLLLVGVALFFRARAETVIGVAPDRPRSRRRGGGRRAAAGGRVELRMHRWPLPRYVGTRFVQLALLAFGALLMAYLLIDVMERLSWFARYQATGSEALRFYLTRIPLLAARVVPMALLVATAMLVSLLAVDGELIGMRACGISAPRALVAVLLVAALVAPGFFLFKSVLVPRAYREGEELKRAEIKAEYHARRAARLHAPQWLFSGSHVVEAERFDEYRGWADQITIYDLDAAGLPVRRTDALSARHIGRGVWRLTEPASIEVSDGSVHRVPPRRFEDLGERLRTEVDTRELSVAELAETIEDMEASGLDATLFRVDMHLRFAEALSCVVLPAVVLFFAVGGPPFPGPAQNLLVSAILGVGYILLTSISVSFSNRGTLPPLIGGWGPMLFFGGLAAFFGVRMMRRL
jgi:lipopolysaccharide export system permease protein